MTEEVGDEVDTQVILVVSGKFSSGFDEVPFNMLKLSKDQISKPMVKIINKLFQQGSFPAELKKN